MNTSDSRPPCPRPPEPSEFVAKTLSVHGPKSVGCQTHGRHAMVSFTREGDHTVYDLLLTADQAARLIDGLVSIVSPTIR